MFQHIYYHTILKKFMYSVLLLVSITGCSTEIPDPIIQDEISAREDVLEGSSSLSVTESLLYPPTFIGGWSYGDALILWIEEPEEYQVIHNVELRHRKSIADLSTSGYGYFSFNQSSNEIYGVEIQTDLVEHRIKVKLLTRELLNVKGGSLIEICRSFAFKRKGFGLSVKTKYLPERLDPRLNAVYSPLAADDVISTKYNSGGTEEILALMTGGGLCPLDQDVTLVNYENARKNNDFLALRRYLRRQLQKKNNSIYFNKSDYSTCKDPMTVYWAARIYAGQGKYDVLKTVLTQNKMADYWVSAIYQAIIDTKLEESTKFLTDVNMYKELCKERGVRLRRNWLAPLIASNLDKDDVNNLREGLLADSYSEDELVFAVDILLHSKIIENVNTVMLISPQKEGKLGQMIYDRLSRIVVSYEFVRNEDMDRFSLLRKNMEIHDRNANPKYLYDWWEKNKERIYWNEDIRKFVAGESDKTKE